MSSILRLIVTSVLRFIWGKAEAWHQAELRDRRNRKIVMDGLKEVVNEAKERNIEIADSPESVGESIDRLRNFARKRKLESGGSLNSDRQNIEPLRLGEANANRTRRIAENSPADSTGIPSTLIGGSGSDSSGE